MLRRIRTASTGWLARWKSRAPSTVARVETEVARREPWDPRTLAQPPAVVEFVPSGPNLNGRG